MENGALVSLIIPVYNVRPYLAEALDSAVHQTYGHLEIIVIDDGSTDGSGEMCDEYAEKDRRIRVVHQENKGLSAARNAGLDRMTGEAVAFLDSDDAFDPSFVERMLAAMIRENADQVICRYSVHHTSGTLRNQEKESILPLIQPGVYGRAGVLQALFEGTINVSVWGKLYKREIWNGFRFRAGHVYEDNEASYKAGNQCERAYVLDDLLYLYRKRPGSITNTATLQNVNDRFLAASLEEALVRREMTDIYSQEQLERLIQMRRDRMIHWCIRWYGLHKTQGDDGKTAGKELRRRILAYGKENGMDGWKPRTKTVYRLLRLCPRLLRIAYSVYLPAKRMLRRLTG